MINSNEVEVSSGSDGRVTITAGGMLDLTNTDKLRDELKAAAAGAENVTLDLQTAKFIDTAVVQYIANAATTMMNRNKRLQVLVCKNSHPNRVFEIVGFGEIMDISADGCQDS